MLRLANTTDKIEIVLAGAPATTQPCAYASYNDVDATSVTPGRNALATNGSTAVDLVAAPASGYQRLIDEIGVYNRDTASVTLTVRFDFNGTEYPIWVGVLGVGERLQYNDKTGWQVYMANGQLKVVTTNGLSVGASWTEVVLASDQINNNVTANTLADLTGLVHAITAGNVYEFELIGVYLAAATTTGSRWTVNGPAATWMGYNSWFTLTATGASVNYAGAYQQPAASNASSLTTGNMVWLKGMIKPSSSGNLQAQFASEVSSSAITAKEGMVFRVRQVL